MPHSHNRARDLVDSLRHGVASDERELSAAERFKVWYDTHPDDSTRPRLEAGLLSEVGCYAEALPLFEQVEHWRKAGDCLWALGRLEEACESYERPSNQNPQHVFRAGPDFDRLLALCAIIGDWKRIPRLIRAARPEPYGSRDVFLGGQARAKGPILRYLALAVRHGEEGLKAAELSRMFGISATDWTVIAAKEAGRRDADLQKQIAKLRPRFLKIEATTRDAALAVGSTERATRLIDYIGRMDRQLPEMTANFAHWKKSSGDPFPASIIFWLTETGVYQLFKTVLHALRCEIDTWLERWESESRFYTAHPWIIRACLDEAVRSTLKENKSLTADILTAALFQHLWWALALDIHGKLPENATYDRLRAEPDWAWAQLNAWAGSEAASKLAKSVNQSLTDKRRWVKLEDEPAWSALMRAAAAHLDTRWEVDFASVRWKSEQSLFLRVKQMLPDLKVEQHASPVWLSPQHLDVYLPERRIAIEYQGEQHYRPIEVFGGEEGFQATSRRDALKRQLCALAGITLIEVRYDDDIDARLQGLADLVQSGRRT
jgi:tetratricopeptide (TPR) repeat protein